MDAEAADEAAAADVPTAADDAPEPPAAPAAPAPAPDAESTPATASFEQHPFETDPGDHAETPFEAYQHIEPLLARLAKCAPIFHHPRPRPPWGAPARCKLGGGRSCSRPSERPALWHCRISRAPGTHLANHTTPDHAQSPTFLAGAWAPPRRRCAFTTHSTARAAWCSTWQRWALRACTTGESALCGLQVHLGGAVGV